MRCTSPNRFVSSSGHLDVLVFRPRNLEGETCRCELNEPQAEVAGVGIMIVGLDVADAAVIVLKLTLNDKIRVIRPRQIKVIVAGGLAIEKDLEVLVAGLSVDGRRTSAACLGTGARRTRTITRRRSVAPARFAPNGTAACPAKRNASRRPPLVLRRRFC